MPTQPTQSLTLLENLEHRIYVIRGEKVMLDSDLAELYGVPTRVLNQAVKRNRKRFPEDFMFRLNRAETEELNRSQIVTGSQKHRDPRYLPFAFTEHGAVMLASVLNSPTAIAASIQVVRAFIRLRSILAAHKELALKIDALERKMKASNEETKTNFVVIFKFIEDYRRSKRELPPAIGFRIRGKK